MLLGARGKKKKESDYSVTIPLGVLGQTKYGDHAAG